MMKAGLESFVGIGSIDMTVGWGMAVGMTPGVRWQLLMAFRVRLRQYYITDYRRS